jgi:hypothetical protein
VLGSSRKVKVDLDASVVAGFTGGHERALRCLVRRVGAGTAVFGSGRRIERTTRGKS